jgi:uncharacterized protein
MKLLVFILVAFPLCGITQFEIKKANLTKIQAVGSYYVDGMGVSKDKHGIWKYYDKYGELEEERNYYRGKLSGKVMLYYPNNKPRQEGYFKIVRQDPADEKKDIVYQDSVYREWYETGLISKEGIFSLGKPKGVWKHYYVDGREKSVEEEKDSINYVLSFWLPDEQHTQTVMNGTGEVTLYHSTGVIKEWYNYKNGLQNGPFEERSIYGYSTLTGFFKDGEKEGEWKYFYYTGAIEKSSNYKEGKLNGPYNYYYDNGQLNVVGSYVNGKKEGVWKWFTNVGSPDMQGSFVNDLQEGEWIYWYGSGEKSYTAHYLKGLKTGHWVYLYKDGKTFKTGDFSNDLKDGKWQTWYENGVLLMDGNYTKGKEEGLWVNYWDNGKVKNSVTFRQGEMHGKWQSFSPTGHQVLQGKYKNNYKTGEWTDYYENGMPKDVVSYVVKNVKSKVEYGVMKNRVVKESVKQGRAVSFSSKDYKRTEEGKYKNGDKDGEWIAYYPGGKIAAVITHYADGELHGAMKQFDRMGNLTSEINYAKGLKEGLFILYGENGKIVSKKNFKGGEEVR